MHNLNSAQRDAVNIGKGAALVLSGAGTGKTTVVTQRIANIIRAGNYADGVIAMTFTNKAAKEMKQRIEKILNQSYENLIVGTFHSVAARFLRKYAGYVGLKNDFIILGESDSMRMITMIMEDSMIDKKMHNPKTISYLVSKIKEDGVHCNDDSVLNVKYRDINIGKIYQEYQHRLRLMNAMDFGDLMLEFKFLLINNPNVLEIINNQYNYIVIDEYQDTNKIQNEIAKILSKQHGNIFCVGDEDQSIYSWRGAEIGNILNFKEDFANAKIIKLEENYRSTKKILQVANSLISKNKGRYDKNLFSSLGEGDDIRSFYFESDKQEAFYISEITKKALTKFSANEIAILVRQNTQIRVIEDVLITNQIKYFVVDGVKFYERREIKDMLAYIRFCVNQNDILAFERIVNLPKRGIGEKTILDIISETNSSTDRTILDTCVNFFNNGKLKGSQIEGMEKFIELIKRFQQVFSQDNENFAKNIHKLFIESQYAELLNKDAEENESEIHRIDNVRDFIKSAEEFQNLTDFLEHISLASATDGKEEDAIRISTIHAAKGLEYDVVILPGWEEGIMPSLKSESERGLEGIEEERRLGYVAITRAKQSLFITNARTRSIFGKTTYQEPSRFLNDLQGVIKVKANQNVVQENHFTRKKIENPKIEKMGDKIIHNKFGLGKIIKENDKFFEVQFDGLKMMISKSSMS